MTGVVRTSEPKHSNELLRKSVGERKLRRGLTQRELSEAIGGALSWRCAAMSLSSGGLSKNPPTRCAGGLSYLFY